MVSRFRGSRARTLVTGGPSRWGRASSRHSGPLCGWQDLGLDWPPATGGEPVVHTGEKLFLDAIRALEHALEAKDAYTAGHSARVSLYGVAIARELGLRSSEVEDIALGGELHDIGKIGVPEELLHKQGPLTPDEHHRVMEHPAIGERILRPLLAHRPIALAVVRWHHEWVNGQGHPDGLPGQATPLAARIIAVADAFDAMTSVRPYRSARTSREAMGELKDGSGVQFDEVCVAAFALALEHDPQVRLIAP